VAMSRRPRYAIGEKRSRLKKPQQSAEATAMRSAEANTAWPRSRLNHRIVSRDANAKVPRLVGAATTVA
jgi:hypothetical protein